MQPVFYYDFGSPNAYFAHKVLPDIERRTGAVFRYVPILLGGLFKLSGNQAPMLAFADVPNKLAYENRQILRFIERHGLSQFQMNPHFPVNTLMLMRGAVAAEEAGIGIAYIEAAFHYMWEEPRKLDDPEILSAALTEAKLPADRIFALAQDQAVKDRLAVNTEGAYKNGAFGSPSFLVGSELFFGKDSLNQVEEEITKA